MTREHRAGSEPGGAPARSTVDVAPEAGDLILVDVDKALATFMVDNMLDAGLFCAFTTRAIQQLPQGRHDCTMRACGELVDALSKAGPDSAAISVEL